MNCGAELVALEWLQGPGRGVLRLYIDHPGGDPRVPPSAEHPGATADLCAAVSRAAADRLDELDVIELAYDLEVSTPGFERPVQKRADFDRFVGLTAKVRTRAAVDGRTSFEAVLDGTVDAGESFAVRLRVGEREVVVPVKHLLRARLVEIKQPKASKPGKGPKAPHPKRAAEPKAAGQASS